MLHILVALALIDPGQAAGPSPECVEQPSACRVLEPYELRVGDATVTTMGGDAVPWVNDGALLVVVGESVVFEVAGDKPVATSGGRAEPVVAEAQAKAMLGLMEGTGDEEPRAHTGEDLRRDPPPGRIRATLFQSPEAEDMILMVENGYEGALTYRASMLVIGQDGAQWRPTSVCTVLPGIYGIEHWPHHIVAVALEEFRLAPKGDTSEVICR